MLLAFTLIQKYLSSTRSILQYNVHKCLKLIFNDLQFRTLKNITIAYCSNTSGENNNIIFSKIYYIYIIHIHLHIGVPSQ